MVKSGDAVKNAGLSSTIRTDYRGDYSRFYDDVYVGEGVESAKGEGYVGNG